MPPKGKPSIQTAVRSLQPQELFALTAENERLLQLERDLKAREDAIAAKENAATEMTLRLQAQNDELRGALDMAMMNGGGGANPAELASLKRQLQENEEAAASEASSLRQQVQEVEARRVLERSEETAKLAKLRGACEEATAALGAANTKLDTLEAAHAHATSLLTSLQSSHDEAVAARRAAELERDRLADLLARAVMSDDDAPPPAAASSSADDALRAAIHETLLARELCMHEVESEDTVASLRQALEHAERFHAAALDAKGRELARAIEQVHCYLASTLAVDVSTRVLRAEISQLEADAHAHATSAADHQSRCRAALEVAAKATEAQADAEARANDVEANAEATVARASAAAEAAQRVADETRSELADAATRATALQQRYEAAEAQSLLDAQRVEEAQAARAAAKARVQSLEGELAAARATVDRGAAQISRLESDLAGRDAVHEKAVQTLKGQQREHAKMREALLKEAVGRAEVARAELAELQAQVDEAADDAYQARDGEELALSHVSKLEQQLEELKKLLAKKDDQLQAMARRLEVLAQASTESHKHDIGYWGERAKRSEFATAAYTVGGSKRAAQKVAQAALSRAKALDGAPTRTDATDATSTSTVTRLPKLASAKPRPTRETTSKEKDAGFDDIP